MIDDVKCGEIVLILSEVLHTHCSTLNTFLEAGTLAKFANKMFEVGIITTELRDNPVYNKMEKQFIEALSILSTQAELEKYCKNFLTALRTQGGPLELFATKIKGDWEKNIMTKLHASLNL